MCFFPWIAKEHIEKNSFLSGQNIKKINNSINSGISLSIPRIQNQANSEIISITHSSTKFSHCVTVEHIEHIGRLDRMSVSGYRGRRFEPRHKYVVSLSKTLSSLLQSTQLRNEHKVWTTS